MSLKDMIFGKPEEKKVPPVGMLVEETRSGIHKAYIPKFLYIS